MDNTTDQPLTLPTLTIHHAPGCRGNCTDACWRIVTPSRYTIDAEADGHTACPRCGAAAFYDHDSNTSGCTHCGLSIAYVSDETPEPVDGVLHIGVMEV